MFIRFTKPISILRLQLLFQLCYDITIDISNRHKGELLSIETNGLHILRKLTVRDIYRCRTYLKILL